MVEYILLVTAVLGVFLVFLRPGGDFHKAVNNTVTNGTLDMLKKSNDLKF
jgi:hypothetical protein